MRWRSSAAKGWLGEKRSSVSADRVPAAGSGGLRRAPRPGQRRRVLLVSLAATALVVTAAAWAVPRVSDAAERWLTQPPVRTRTVALDGVRPGDLPAALRSPGGKPAKRASRADAAIVDAGITFNLLGVVASKAAGGAADGAQDDALVVRVSGDGREWSEWITLELLENPSDADASGEAGTAFVELSSEPLWVGDARFVQFQRRGQARDLRLAFINSMGDATVADRALHSVKSAVAMVAGIGRGDAAQAAPARPDIVTRAEWGANESWRRAAPSYATVKMAFVHHTASLNSYTPEEAPAVVRAVYSYHARTLEFNDIGYNFLIDRYGVIYEGRYGGIDRGVVGAQTLGFNTGSTGVSVIGEFTTSAPPAAALTSLERLLAWKLAVHGVDPLSPVTMVCGASDKFREGQYVTLPAISGHRDACYTSCPGNAFYAKLPQVRNAVKELTPAGEQVFRTRAAKGFVVRRGRVAKFRYRVAYAPAADATQVYRTARVVIKVHTAAGKSRYTKIIKNVPLNSTRFYSMRCWLAKGAYRYSIYARLPDGTRQDPTGGARFAVK